MALLGEIMVSVTDLSKSIGPREILKPMSFTIHKGDKNKEQLDKELRDIEQKIRLALYEMQLLSALQAIEARRGPRAAFRNAPRALDLDLLLVDRCERSGALLTLPHPRMHERAFVLVPLLEIAPEVSIPGLGPASGLVRGTAGQRVERIT